MMSEFFLRGVAIGTAVGFSASSLGLASRWRVQAIVAAIIAIMSVIVATSLSTRIAIDNAVDGKRCAITSTVLIDVTLFLAMAGAYYTLSRSLFNPHVNKESSQLA